MAISQAPSNALLSSQHSSSCTREAGTGVSSPADFDMGASGRLASVSFLERSSCLGQAGLVCTSIGADAGATCWALAPRKGMSTKESSSSFKHDLLNALCLEIIWLVLAVDGAKDCWVVARILGVCEVSSPWYGMERKLLLSMIVSKSVA